MGLPALISLSFDPTHFSPPQCTSSLSPLVSISGDCGDESSFPRVLPVPGMGMWGWGPGWAAAATPVCVCPCVCVTPCVSPVSPVLSHLSQQLRMWRQRLVGLLRLCGSSSPALLRPPGDTRPVLAAATRCHHTVPESLKCAWQLHHDHLGTCWLPCPCSQPVPGSDFSYLCSSEMGCARGVHAGLCVPCSFWEFPKAGLTFVLGLEVTWQPRHRFPRDLFGLVQPLSAEAS